MSTFFSWISYFFPLPHHLIVSWSRKWSHYFCSEPEDILRFLWASVFHQTFNRATTAAESSYGQWTLILVCTVSWCNSPSEVPVWKKYCSGSLGYLLEYPRKQWFCMVQSVVLWNFNLPYSPFPDKKMLGWTEHPAILEYCWFLEAFDHMFLERWSCSSWLRNNLHHFW